MQTAENKRPRWRTLRRTFGGITALLAGAAVIWFTIALSESRIVGPRAPYLQLAGAYSITLRWGTEQAAADTVFYGLTPGDLSKQVRETQAQHNHRVTLHELQPDTRYYYRIQHAGHWLMPEAAWFVTAPQPGQARPLRAWILGDPGKYRAREAVRDAALRWLRQDRRDQLAYADLLLTTGDHAYPNGTLAQFMEGFLVPYQEVLRNIPLWPVLGNHDARRWAFYQLFDSPQEGELGGVPSQHQGYYAFDYGQTHFVILDSQDGDLTPPSPMLAWLEADLQANQRRWTVVLFHHPPYTKGTHDSDNARDSRGRMQYVREYIAPILDRYGVDLVLAGHSHVYERSHLMHCHYGSSDSFANWMIQDAGQMQGGQTVYTKSAAAQYSGTMYMVLGSSGEGNRGPFDHPALPVHSDQPGSLVLDIAGDTLHARYLTASGEIGDEFRIEKNAQANTQTNKDACRAD